MIQKSAANGASIARYTQAKHQNSRRNSDS